MRSSRWLPRKKKSVFLRGKVLNNLPMLQWTATPMCIQAILTDSVSLDGWVDKYRWRGGREKERREREGGHDTRRERKGKELKGVERGNDG